MKYVVLLANAFAVATISFPAGAADHMQPGQWDMSLTTDGASHTVSHCVTPEEAASVNGTPDEARQHADAAAAKAHCALKAFDEKGETVAYTLTCGARTIESTATYKGVAYTGVLTTTQASGAAPVKTYVKAQRTGACP